MELSGSEEGSDAASVFVDNGDVYVAGLVHGSRGTVALYWKNGQAVELSDREEVGKEAIATSVFVDDGDVYVSGSYGGYFSSGSDRDAVYWKNGTMVTLPDIVGEGREIFGASIFVDKGDVYVTREDEDGVYPPVYWKNGEAVELSDKAEGFAEAHSVFVHNGDVYVAGGKENERNEFHAAYWKNGNVEYLPTTDGHFSGSYAVFVTRSLGGE